MKKALLSMSMLGLLAGSAYAADIGVAVQPVPVVPVVHPGPIVIFQLGPTTPYSTIDCSEFVKLDDGAWKAIGSVPFGLGFTQGIIPPVRPIKVGSFIYNNIDLYSQLESQCVGTLVRARY